MLKEQMCRLSEQELMSYVGSGEKYLLTVKGHLLYLGQTSNEDDHSYITAQNDGQVFDLTAAGITIRKRADPGSDPGSGSDSEDLPETVLTGSVQESKGLFEWVANRTLVEWLLAESPDGDAVVRTDHLQNHVRGPREDLDWVKITHSDLTGWTVSQDDSIAMSNHSDDTEFYIYHDGEHKKVENPFGSDISGNNSEDSSGSDSGYNPGSGSGDDPGSGSGDY